MNPPVKPFDTYKWRWATLTPTESLNSPPVFIGVLRVFNRLENFAPSSNEVMDALGVVQNETHTNVDLVRTRERNLIRNSGQYWKGLGVLQDAHGLIQLTDLGRALANGDLSQLEFAMTVIKTLELPNRRIQADAAVWDNAGIRIKPLELVLDIIADLSVNLGSQNAYVSPDELVRIIIPLAGVNSELRVYREALSLHRAGRLDLNNWPDCAPSSNDRRMAREFLLFLANYGFCRMEEGISRTNSMERYFLSSITPEEIIDFSLVQEGVNITDTINRVRQTQVPSNVERRRVLREVIDRPSQSGFRKDILEGYNSTCLITGVSLHSVLEAAHIIPVRENGLDTLDNGICLRVDIHRLFDSNHLRITPDGDVLLSNAARNHSNYHDLPRSINLPSHTNRDNLHWRLNYY